MTDRLLSVLWDGPEPTTDEAREALQKLVHRKHTLSVPVQRDDADVVLARVIRHRDELAALLARVKAWDDGSPPDPYTTLPLPLCLEITAALAKT